VSTQSCYTSTKSRNQALLDLLSNTRRDKQCARRPAAFRAVFHTCASLPILNQSRPPLGLQLLLHLLPLHDLFHQKCSSCGHVNACRQGLPTTRACCCQLVEMSSHLQSRAPLGKQENSYSTERFLSITPERINLHALSSAIYTIRRRSKSTAATLCGSSETRYYHLHVRGGIHCILLRPVCAISYTPHISLADVSS
jgi:hypothetical protein